VNTNNSGVLKSPETGRVQKTRSLADVHETAVLYRFKQEELYTHTNATSSICLVVFGSSCKRDKRPFLKILTPFFNEAQHVLSSEWQILYLIQRNPFSTQRFLI
jgi:hypothetical protein